MAIRATVREDTPAEGKTVKEAMAATGKAATAGSGKAAILAEGTVEADPAENQQGLIQEGEAAKAGTVRIVTAAGTGKSPGAAEASTGTAKKIATAGMMRSAGQGKAQEASSELGLTVPNS